jgi:hypothetical protein
VANAYQLEHFYRGQLVITGTPQEDLRLLAASPGVKPELVAEAVQIALMPPTKDNASGAVSLVRGKGGSYYFVQTQIAGAGQVMTHVVLLPADLVRSLSGNLKALLGLVQPTLPTFEKGDARLPLLPFMSAEPPLPQQQTRALLALMTASRDRIQTIETMLASIIGGTPLIVMGAPPELEARLSFVEGLQALLPPPARAGVTFATHSAPLRTPEAIIIFYPDAEPPADVTTYRWQDATTGGLKATDDYARYITSQLRLDTTLVLEQTAGLTPVAGWRIRQGDSLGDALRYASKRLRIDNAVLNNQPVELVDAAQILTDDPSLTEALKLAYVSHIVKLALPLADTERLQMLGRVVRGDEELENALLRQIEEFLSAGVHAGTIFDALVDWLSTTGGFRGLFWSEQAQRAAKMHADSLIRARDAAGLAHFLHSAGNAPPHVNMDSVLPGLLDQAMPLASDNDDLARMMFTRAAATYPTDRFMRLFAERDLINRLPPVLARLQPHLLNASSEDASGLLAGAARAFGEEDRDRLAVRFAEIAITNGNPTLIDAPTLALLAEAAASESGSTYDQTLRWLTRNLATEPVLVRVGETGAEHLLRIQLSRRAYNDFAVTVAVIGRALYRDQETAQTDFAEFIERLFLYAHLPAEDAQAALDALANSGLKPLVMMRAHYAVQSATDWSPAVAKSAAALNTLVMGNPRVALQLPIELHLGLVQYHMRREDAPSATRIADVLPEIAINEGEEEGVRSMLRMCKLLSGDEALRKIAVDLLRKYVRKLPSGDDRRAAARISERMGEKVKTALLATLIFKRMFDGVPIEEYTAQLHITTALLHDTAVAFVDKERYPGLKIIMSDLDSLSGGITREERRELGREILDLGKLIVSIAQKHRMIHPRQTDAQLEALIAGRAEAAAPLDVLRIAGGYFAEGANQREPITQSATGHPLGTRGARDVLDQVKIALKLLRNFARAFPTEPRGSYNPVVLRGELESMWDEVSANDQNQLVRNLSRDFQRLPDLIIFIAERGSARALLDDDRNMRRLELGERKPESTLELYRLISGYFRARAR